MDFLRSSGHDNGSRERKPSSYGSLGNTIIIYAAIVATILNHFSLLSDRSWSRKMRTGTATKKRPDLLNIDFGADRERAQSPSPSPLSEAKALPSSQENKPRELRQKIESWLEANKQDEKDDHRSRSRRLVSNRRSFENDSGSNNSPLLGGFKRGLNVSIRHSRKRTKQTRPPARGENLTGWRRRSRTV